LQKAGAPVEPETGTAEETLGRIIPKLDRFGLHFAFLDPYNLDSLSFELIRKLAGLQRMDILIHVSLQDLNRNLLRYLGRASSPLDSFAPDWRAHVDRGRSLEHVRGKLFEYWRSLVRQVGMSTAETAELVVGPNNQPLYWLAFVARHERALEFWEKIRNLEAQKQDEMF
jgi:three-Cys-motif partner protein